MSCFVTERKHRSSKKSALHVFRYMEHTVLADQINQFCMAMSTDALFSRASLIGPKQHSVHEENIFFNSKSALLSCGEIIAGDIVYLTDRSIGRVERFWQKHVSNDIVVELQALPSNPVNPNVVNDTSNITIFETAEAIIDACPWVRASANTLRVLEPFASRGVADLLP